MAESEFQLKDEPVENLRPLKVRVIGAGFSGILAAIRIPQKLRNIDLVVYEKNEGLGGVWWLNRYPGVACDIPSHSYQYSFAPNPHWSSLYAPGREIQQYLQGVAEKFGATRFIKTSHKLVSAVWDATTKQWRLTVLNTRTGETVEEACHVLITARGQLNSINWPDIAGLDRFKGQIMHSADWEEEYDFANKRVAVVGNGSSAIQIVPRLQQTPNVHLKVFMRSPTWIASRFGDHAMVQLGLDPSEVDFPLEKRQAWADDPEAYLRVRKVIEDDGQMVFDYTIRGSGLQKVFEQTFRADMRQRLAKRPDLFDLMVPAFAPGCRRLTPGVGYLEALMADNVEVIPHALAGVTETGVLVAAAVGKADDADDADEANGHLRELPVDVLVCATGFKVSEAPPFAVTGRNGLTLAQRWADFPDSYLSVAVDGFPNLFMLFGPNSAIGAGSLTIMLESTCDYVVQLLRKIQREDYAAIEPHPDRVADFVQYADAYFRRTVFTDSCRSWYRSHAGLGDRVCGLWPGSALHALEVLRSPRWEDFVYEPADPSSSPNRLRWLGNGRSLVLTAGDPSWYLNPDEVDMPLQGRPEDEPRYKARPWSY